MKFKFNKLLCFLGIHQYKIRDKGNLKNALNKLNLDV